ncbi:hypothetical protein FOA52_007677 [Chlamydomonas sp. UWO 241]|nr:hypothetical protein FOA52_007677 [Chlamydomonas sp. UWO 241]
MAISTIKSRFLKADLVAACTQHGLDSSGFKDDLVNRLEAFFGAEVDSGPTNENIIEWATSTIRSRYLKAVLVDACMKRGLDSSGTKDVLRAVGPPTQRSIAARLSRGPVPKLNPNLDTGLLQQLAPSLSGYTSVGPTDEYISTMAINTIKSRYLKADLVAACTQRGLDSSGFKDDLVNRLRAFVGAEVDSGPTNENISEWATSTIKSRYLKAVLVDACMKRGLDSSGTKDDLVSTLKAYVGDE